MSLDVAEHVTQCAIPVINKPFNLDNRIAAVESQRMERSKHRESLAQLAPATGPRYADARPLSRRLPDRQRRHGLRLSRPGRALRRATPALDERDDSPPRRAPAATAYGQLQ